MVIETWKQSGIATKFPTYRNSKLITTKGWLLGKQNDDEAEGLWRIYDGIYDFTEFINEHPGGEFWLIESKGTDITEAFEAHHISKGPHKLLQKYKVRDAKNPRIYTLTLHEDGFYKTLRERVRETLKTIDTTPKKKSDLIHLSLFVSIYIFAVLSARLNSILCLALAGTALCWTTIVAHNYFHRRDNWRMYTFNMNLELSMFEPLVCWIPNPYIKSKMMRYLSIITEPLTYCIAFPLQKATRIIYSLRYNNIMYWHDILSLSIPLTIFLFSDLSLLLSLRQWVFITMIASFAFCVIGLNAAHHDPEIYHEGDAAREDRDWGLFQVDTIIDRGDLKGSQFLVLTHFGDHILHHLFPTLDHGILPQLYPVLYETLDQFKGKLRECNHLEHMLGQHMQLLRTTPNTKPQGS
ncbi:cytochrome b5-related protein isoform X2 [Bactrocera neohumeralis]|uniref:cytochrome b5-related protein isoform X2 n=1 Tax=Bactrocera tryoni TaxID=59916 RepID=UPI001A979A8C|nr:cytochrome b5-related protein isoform X2 [Bactrocera tryoni]XP_050338901.1 cytochrome b5-related protein isoform X2 [Bactrocera neohumeralis]